MNNTTESYCKTIIDACEAQRAAWDAYAAKRDEVTGNSMLSPSGRQKMQDALDAEWQRQKSALLDDVKAALDGIYQVEGEKEVGFIVDPGISEAVALLDRLGDTLPARSIFEIGTRFLGNQPALRTLAKYAVERAGIPKERVESGLSSMMYDSGLIRDMRDAIESDRHVLVAQKAQSMDGGIVESGAAAIAASFERPQWKGGEGKAGHTWRVF